VGQDLLEANRHLMMGGHDDGKKSIQAPERMKAF
jgi:hypothetical protein